MHCRAWRIEKTMSSVETGLSALLILLALGIVFCGPARLLRWWVRLRRALAIYGRSRNTRAEPLQEEQ